MRRRWGSHYLAVEFGFGIGQAAMRLWSLHPRYLDSKGLVALWRESLLAQKVLTGNTEGYRRHPQLERFRAHPDSAGAIANYLHEVCVEADRRGYRFDRSRICLPVSPVPLIEVTCGQLQYEMAHLAIKLKVRAPDDWKSIVGLDRLEPHPLFAVVDGPVAPWERPG